MTEKKVLWIKKLKRVTVEYYHKHSIVYGTVITAYKKAVKEE